MLRLLRRLKALLPLYLGRGLFAFAVMAGLLSPLAFAPGSPAVGQATNGVCIPSTISYSPTWYPACDATGHMLVTGSITVNPGPTDAAGIPYVHPTGGPFPVSGTVTANAGTGFQSLDGSGYGSVDVQAWSVPSSTVLGKVVSAQPYTFGAAQTLTAGSFVGVLGSNGTTGDPLLDVNGGQLRVTTYSTTGVAQVISGSGIAETVPCNQSGICANALAAGNITDGESAQNALNGVVQNLAYNGATWDRFRKDSYAAGPLWVTPGGGNNAAVAIAAGTAGPSVVKGSAGRLARVVITTAGSTGTETFYDNASACSGTVIGVIAGTTALATAVAGAPPYALDMYAANGITGCGGTGSPGVSVGYF